MEEEKEAVEKLAGVYRKNPLWRELTQRVVTAGIVTIDKNILKKLI